MTKQAISLKFWILVEEYLLSACNDYKDANQLCSCCVADLCSAVVFFFAYACCWFSCVKAHLGVVVFVNYATLSIYLFIYIYFLEHSIFIRFKIYC